MHAHDKRDRGADRILGLQFVTVPDLLHNAAWQARLLPGKWQQVLEAAVWP